MSWNAVWSHPHRHGPEQRTAMVPGGLQHRVVLKGVLQRKDYIFTKWALETNDIGNTPGKKGLLSTEGGVQEADKGAAAGFFDSIYQY
ncbi:hypothetical protein B9Z19DRAFT_1086645 [Tuber borchii]|uniref:Uncharacterized protein n=1 Tax=Tuber borchii TaxID=42251 RepID=A0A2T6ZP34_TUBBO|nr:hypothetical protein B9Z19DRAFT_1086645 [Tuber borchii]